MRALVDADDSVPEPAGRVVGGQLVLAAAQHEDVRLCHGRFPVWSSGAGAARPVDSFRWAWGSA
ncbi:hypothetical protein GA0115244_112522 [Streptomyces sp. DvalAA-19]|nr:hypothetical protein GA0115244_112522 [Streptomyces sp. DvalAA-19]